MSLDRFWYELRIMGKWVIIIPLLIMLSFAFLAALLTIMQVSHLRISQVLTASLEMILPLVAGLLTATIISHDAAIELQLTMPKSYRVTAFVRLSMIIAWTSCIALFSSVFIYHLRFWRVPSQVETWKVLPQFLIGQLTWVAPLLWFVGLGICLALLIRSSSASSALLGGIWIIEAIFYGYFAITGWLKPMFLFSTTLAPDIDFWLSNRFELLVTALVLILLGWFMLGNTELLLQGTAGEE
ncbi:MAG TPA: hypothetical protein VFZ02_09155 [Ktedonobacteraceae bacterium]